MSSQPPQPFMDTVQIEVDGEKLQPGASGDAQNPDFAETVQVEDQPEVWAEAPDFQSSESASLFAGTQPAPLSVV